MDTNTIYDQVNARIISLLEAGVTPWRKPWKSRGIKPARNFVSKKQYSGCNFFTVNSMDYQNENWGTFNQIKNLGGNVKKGEKGTQIVFWKLLDSKQKNSKGESKDVQIPLLKTSYIFNFEQCEGLKVGEKEEIILQEHDEIQVCKDIISKFPLGMPELRHEKDRAFYNFSLDYINMPLLGLFENPERYYQTLFHESIHATGHKSRLNRSTLNDIHFFGDENYSQEELVAEMGASYLCSIAKIDDITMENSASYISNWLAALRKDNKLLLKSAAMAKKAVDYLVGKKEVENEE